MSKKPKDMSVEEIEAELPKADIDEVRLILLKENLKYLLSR